MQLERTVKPPLVLELTPNGKTLVVFYEHCQAMVIARVLAIMGDPELVCPGDDNPNIVAMLWPHQDMPDEIKIVAEQMSTANMLNSLGYDKVLGEL